MKYSYLNNYSQTIALPVGAASLALSLPDGLYRLTLTDDGQSAFEVIDATVSGGTGTLTRGLEGTSAQDWPAGSTIYCDITADGLTRFGGLSGAGNPNGSVIAPELSRYLDESNGDVWVCVYSDGVSADWEKLQKSSPASDLISESFDFYGAQEGEYLINAGTTVQFIDLDGSVYSSVALDSGRSFVTSTVCVLRSRATEAGNLIVTVTPVTEYPA